MKKLLLSIIAALAMTALLTPSARAEVKWIEDPKEADVQYDISAVKVTYGPKNLFVRVKYRGLPGYEARVWIDTRSGDQGPEFLSTWTAMRPRKSLYRVNNFEADGQTKRTCANLDITYYSKTNVDLLFMIPRGCMKIDKVTPKGVRVAVVAEANWWDWVPAQNRFSSWIQPG